MPGQWPGQLGLVGTEVCQPSQAPGLEICPSGTITPPVRGSSPGTLLLPGSAPEFNLGASERKPFEFGVLPSWERQTYGFLDFAAKDVDPEELGVVVAFREGEAVALGGPVVASHAEEDLVNGVVGDFGVRRRFQQPFFFLPQLKNNNKPRKGKS